MGIDKRLIDVNALGIGRCDPDLIPIQNRAYCAGWNGVVNLIEQAPTVDAVEVVRCKDCKHKYYNEHTEMYCCEQWADGFDTAVRDDEFCSRGERKRNGKE